MKNNIILLVLIIAGLFYSCSDDFLDREPLNKYSEAAVWSDLALVETFVNHLYNGVFDEASVGTMRSTYSDNAFLLHNWGASGIVQGTISPDQWWIGWGRDSQDNPWAINYEFIRGCNMFLSKIKDVPADSDKDKEWKEQLTGQVHFLRAYFYYDLYRFFGGVPLIDNVYSLDDDFLNVTRSTLDETFEFIVSDLEEAIGLLPLEYGSEDLGRSTKGAAMALKSRVLLYGASPLFGTPSASKWQRAADATKELIDLNQYSLTSVSNFNEYEDVFVNALSNEVIWQRRFTPKWDEWPGVNKMQYQTDPPSYGGWTAVNPTQEVVESFEMADGTPAPDFLSMENPYEGRELRFYASVLYNGAEWKGSTFDQFIPNGKDGPQGVVPWNASKTGYAMRKFKDETYSVFEQEPPATPWVFFRYAEVLLNYAECLIELGNEDEARNYINLVRERVHLPTIGNDVTGIELVEKYRHERRIELVFEGYRWFDIRRWKTAMDIMNKPIHGVSITKNSNNTFTYTINKVQDRAMYERNWWVPIPRSEIQKAPQIIQNPGYD